MSGAHHHSSGHSHGHAHGHAPSSHGMAFALGIALNLGFVAVEAGVGIVAGSMALVADAGHNLSDVLALVIAWGASALAARAPSERFTYGFKSSTILAALANAALLLIALGAILVETLRRLADPVPVAGGLVMLVAGVGIVVNTGTALLFLKGRKHDLNIRGAFLHMAADAAVSAGVVLAGLAIVLTGQAWIDPVTSLAIVALIGWGAWGLLKDSLKLGLLGVPQGIDEKAVRGFLAALPGVSAVHDLHIWPMSTTETALTAHLVMPEGWPGDGFLSDVSTELAQHFAIHHATLQIETGENCAVGCD